MPNIEGAVKDLNYNAAATSASKATIFIFIGTFFYMLFGANISPGLIGGTIFFVAGMFTASLAISMPLMILRVKIPKLSPVISIADIAITIFATRWAYLWLFAA